MSEANEETPFDDRPKKTIKNVETCFTYCEKDKGFFSSDEKKWINRLHKLAKEYPDDVQIIREPEDNDDCIYVRLPPSWLKIQPKRKIEMTPEQREASRIRMAELRKKALKRE